MITRQGQEHSLPQLQNFRSALRKDLTPAEAALWNALKIKKLGGKKFRRQHSLGNYIVDFYCAAEKLIIELDGQVHYNAVSSIKDEERDFKLKDLGFTILRFENKDVFNDLEAILKTIAGHFLPKQ